MTTLQNPTIKAVFFDIDGTIFSLKTKSIPESTRNAIKNSRAKGIKIIVATGRSINDLTHIKHIEFDGFLTFNGGYCMTIDGQVMHRQVINPDDIKNLIEYSERSDVSFSLMYEDTVRISHESPKVLELYRHVDIAVPPLCNKENLDVENVLQVNVFIDPENEESFMSEIMPNSLSSRWTPLFADVNPEGVSKQRGVEYFCEYFNFDVSEYQNGSTSLLNPFCNMVNYKSFFLIYLCRCFQVSAKGICKFHLVGRMTVGFKKPWAAY